MKIDERGTVYRGCELQRGPVIGVFIGATRLTHFSFKRYRI